MKELTSPEAWEECLAASAQAPFFVFKHSTRCPISTMAHNKVTDYIAQADDDEAQFFLVNVIESRPLSDAIAQSLHVLHASPQLILVKDGVAVWSASHHGIHHDAITQARRAASV